MLEVESRLLGRDPRSLDPAPTLSLEPERTASALRTGAALALLLVVGTTVAQVCGVRRLALALLVSGAAQALYGILVLASGHPMIWSVPKRYYLESATGTFVNRNHFAGFLELALPCGLALVLASARDRRPAEGPRERWLEHFRPEGVRSLLLGLLLLLGLAGLLLSLSRAGTALGLAALAVTAAVAGRGGLRARVVVLLLVVAVAAVPLLQIGADRLLERYASTAEDFAEAGGRAVVWRDTARLLGDFPLTGAGFGTFAAVYPLYRSPEVRLFFDHAHNDALQALAEGGAIGGALLALVLWPVGRRMVAAFGGGAPTLSVGIAASLTAFLLHGLVDFNFHIPSNAAAAAILAGALLGMEWSSDRS
jgi:O-antigen ligase